MSRVSCVHASCSYRACTYDLGNICPGSHVQVSKVTHVSWRTRLEMGICGRSHMSGSAYADALIRAMAHMSGWSRVRRVISSREHVEIGVYVRRVICNQEHMQPGTRVHREHMPTYSYADALICLDAHVSGRTYLGDRICGCLHMKSGSYIVALQERPLMNMLSSEHMYRLLYA